MSCQHIPLARFAWRRTLGLALLSSSLLSAVGNAWGDEQTRPAEATPVSGDALFQKQVRPLLTKRCLKCHGPAKQESGLRVDSQEYLLTGGDRGPAIVLEDADDSLLMDAVGYQVEDLQMPPNGKLTNEEIKSLREWIELGAPWPADVELAPSTTQTSTSQNSAHPDSSATNATPTHATHWAYQPITSPALPDVHDKTWPLNGIDNFVLHHLEAANLTPSMDADRQVLVRRLYLDLCGLPATHEQIQLFVNDPRPDAYEQLVETLLGRREYAEHWARHWLDVARYADTKGYLDGGQTRYPFAYTYRNYVIRAFAEDLPYGDFVRDQIAADRYDLPESQRWRWAGMGFLTTGRRFNDDPYDTLDDRLDVIGRGLLGITIGCARCHDHKYDPLPTAEYYGLSGILASSYEPEQPELPLLDPSDETAITPEYAEKLNSRLQDFKTEFQKLHDAIQHEMRAFAKDYLVYVVRSNPLHRPDGLNPIKTERTLLRGPTAYGFGALARWERYLDSLPKSDPVFGVWLRLRDIESTSFGAALQPVLQESTIHLDAEVRDAIVRRQPTSMVELAELYGELLETTYQHDETRQGTALHAVLFGPTSPTVMTLDEAIDCYHLDEHVRLRSLRSKIEEVSVQQDNAPARPMMMRDRARPVDPRVLIRGQAQRPGRTVPRALPKLLGELCDTHALTDATSGRRELAEAIVDPRNPLSRRVFVNRLWQWHFGQPLVATPGDFGMRSAAPTHPELLDYLATQLLQTSDSIKHLQRLIVNSRTYRQASRTREAALAVDPENVLMWRYPPHRVPWEVVRDSLLASANCLEPAPNGRPLEVAPDDPNGHCRTLYLLTDRQDVSRLARSFDVASPDFCVDQRSRTGVAQQQLFFLNSPFVIQMAERIAESLPQGDPQVPSDVEQRVVQLFRQTLARDPAAQEIAIAVDYLQGEQDRSGQVSDLQTGDAQSNATELLEDPPTPPLSMWAKLAHILLQSNERVYIE